ncbi:hypothetical protein AAMO2058_001297800 [Amorphochlora amoebiformis]
MSNGDINSRNKGMYQYRGDGKGNPQYSQGSFGPQSRFNRPQFMQQVHTAYGPPYHTGQFIPQQGMSAGQGQYQPVMRAQMMPAAVQPSSFKSLSSKSVKSKKLSAKAKPFHPKKSSKVLYPKNPPYGNSRVTQPRGGGYVNNRGPTPRVEQPKTAPNSRSPAFIPANQHKQQASVPIPPQQPLESSGSVIVEPKPKKAAPVRLEMDEQDSRAILASQIRRTKTAPLPSTADKLTKPGKKKAVSPNGAEKTDEKKMEKKEEAEEITDTSEKSPDAKSEQEPLPASPLDPAPEPDSKSSLGDSVEKKEPEEKTPEDGEKVTKVEDSLGEQTEGKSAVEDPKPDTKPVVPQPKPQTKPQIPQPKTQMKPQMPQPKSQTKPQAPQPKSQTKPQVPQPKAQTKPRLPQPKPQQPKPKPQPQPVELKKEVKAEASKSLTDTSTPQTPVKSQPPLPKPKPQVPKPKPQTSVETSPISDSPSKIDIPKEEAVKIETLPKKDIVRYQAKAPSKSTIVMRMEREEEPMYVYNRDDLMAHSSSNTARPGDLVSILDIKKKLNEKLGQKRPRGSGGRGDSRGDLRRGGNKARNSGGRDRRDRRGDRHRGKDRGPVFLPPVKPLEKSENRFRTGVDKKEKTDDREKTEAAFRRVLNKICPENFESLVNKVISGTEQDLHIDSKGLMDMAAELTFEKAIAESVFCSTYAQFCTSLWRKLPKFEVETGRMLDPKTKSRAGTRIHDFRRVILNKCQQEFELYTNSEKILAVSEEQKVEESKSKKRILGTIRLIGELYVREMITLKIITYCTQLLSRRKPVRPEFIEALCKLLETIGKKLERDDMDYTNNLFKKMEAISDNDGPLDFRHRFMVKDSIDLRMNRWIPRIKKTAAMTKEEFRKQVEKEEAAAAARARGGRGNWNPRMARPQGSSSTTIRKKRSNDEWSTAGGSGSRLGRKTSSQDLRSQDKGSRKMQHQRMGGRSQIAVSRSNEFGQLASSTPARAPEPEKKTKKTESEPKPEKKAITQEDAEKKMHGLLNEYFDARDFKEVLVCVDEIGTKDYNGKIVEFALMKSVEKKDGIKPMGDVLEKLCSEKRLSSTHLEFGFVTILEKVDDLSLDHPKISESLGTIFGRLMLTGSIQMSALEKTLTKEELTKYGEAAKFIFGMLRSVKVIKGEPGLTEFYKDSGLDLKKFMRPRDKGATATIQYIKDRAKDLLILTPLIAE